MKKLIGLAFIVALNLVAMHFTYIWGISEGIMTASVLGILITGAGVQTTFAGQSQCDSYIVIGDVDTANALQGIAVEIDGTPFINIANSAPLVGAFMKWQQEIAGTVVGLMFKVSTGAIKRNTTYRFTNNGATTPTVRVFSDAPNGIPFLATTKTVNISSYEDFNKFSALFLTLPASVSSVEIVFTNGWKATMTIEEVNAYFSLQNQSEADGLLNAVSVIDNTDQSIQSVRVFAGGTAVTVLIVKMPDAAFQALMA
jgi:hypothetical protein